MKRFGFTMIEQNRMHLAWNCVCISCSSLENSSEGEMKQVPVRKSGDNDGLPVTRLPGQLEMNVFCSGVKQLQLAHGSDRPSTPAHASATGQKHPCGRTL